MQYPGRTYDTAYRMFNIARKHIYYGGVVLLCCAGLYATSLHSYLLFHSIAEAFCITIGVTIFIITWNTKDKIQNKYILLVGIAYLFISILDLLHTLAYTGMNIFTGDYYYANQLWIAARYMESTALLAACVFFYRGWTINARLVLLVYALATAVVVAAIFPWHIFPVCYIDGLGQTPFKIISEYVVCGILLAALALLLACRARFNPRILRYLCLSMILTILSELAFTRYVSNYGSANMLGHLLKIASYYLIYKAIIEKGLNRPFDLIFRELQSRQQELQVANATKDRFLAIVSHDLRNPFMGIAGLSKRLLNKYDQITDEEKLKEIGIIHTSSAAAFDLLENLLTWSRTQTDEIACIPGCLDAHQMAERALAVVANSAHGKNITLHNGIPRGMSAYADENMLRTVLRNVLSNAVKFSHAGGIVTLTGNADNGMVTIAVADQGLGMTDEECAALFRLDGGMSRPGTADERGSGLGLILCREFVDRHGARSPSTSSPACGTTVALLLPHPAGT